MKNFKSFFKTLSLTAILITSVQFVNAQCTASFTVDSVSNATAYFSNTSTGSATYWFWDFGDGNNSNMGNNPMHTYNANGTYNVCIYISDSLTNCVDSFCQTITITGAPNCNLNANFTYVDNGNNNYSFTNTSTGSYNFLAWNFGDFNTSFQNNPNHTYANNGTYTVVLLIEDTVLGCQDSAFMTIQANNSTACSVAASFTHVDNGSGNFSSTNNSTGSGTLNYIWYFGDGNTSTSSNPSHTYQNNGTYTVSLFAYDVNDSNCYDYYTATLLVTGTQNTTACNASFVIVPDSNSTNILVFNTSTGNNLTYFWDFGDGNTSTLAYPGYTYSTPGPFLLCLTVTDGNCSSTYCDSIGSNGIVFRQTGFTINVQAPVITGINDEPNTVTEINTYPNPVKDLLTIKLNLIKQTMVEVTLVDLLGNQISFISNEMMNSGSNTLKWNTANLANGVYLLNVKTGNTTTIKKLVINN